MQQAMPYLNVDFGKDAPFKGFANHTVHQALATCSTLRPSVDISVVA
jgi:ketol-acid reductoisomerase